MFNFLDTFSFLNISNLSKILKQKFRNIFSKFLDNFPFFQHFFLKTSLKFFLIVGAVQVCIINVLTRLAEISKLPVNDTFSFNKVRVPASAPSTVWTAERPIGLGVLVCFASCLAEPGFYAAGSLLYWYSASHDLTSSYQNSPSKTIGRKRCHCCTLRR